MIVSVALHDGAVAETKKTHLLLSIRSPVVKATGEKEQALVALYLYVA